MRQLQQIEPLRQARLRLQTHEAAYADEVQVVNQTITAMAPVPGLDEITIVGAAYHIAPHLFEDTGQVHPLVYQAAIHIRDGVGIAIGGAHLNRWQGKIETRCVGNEIGFLHYDRLNHAIQRTVHAELTSLLNALYELIREHLTRLA